MQRVSSVEAIKVIGAGARCYLMRRGWRNRACSARRRGAAFQWLSGHWGDGARLFAGVGRWEPIGRSLNEKSSLSIRRNFIPTRRAPQQSKFHRLLCSVVPQKCSRPVWIKPSQLTLLWAGGWTRWSAEVPSNLPSPVNLCMMAVVTEFVSVMGSCVWGIFHKSQHYSVYPISATASGSPSCWVCLLGSSTGRNNCSVQW